MRLENLMLLVMLFHVALVSVFLWSLNSELRVVWMHQAGRGCLIQ